MEKFNPATIISEGSFLLTAGTLGSYNTMTAGWGQTGVLWQRPVFTAYVRPNRYTFEFTEKNELFTVSFFNQKEYAKMLSFCGSKSGKDYDKAKETGITPFEVDGSVSFREAHTIYVCKKLYITDFSENNFLDKSIYSACYSETNPVHKVYIGEIISAYNA